YKKGLAEPDVYTKIKEVSFFIEVQRNVYSQKVMNDKIKRYEALRYSDEFNQDRFPFIIMISDTRYEINSDLTVFQVKSIHEFMEKLRNKQKNKRREVIKYEIS